MSKRTFQIVKASIPGLLAIFICMNLSLTAVDLIEAYTQFRFTPGFMVFMCMLATALFSVGPVLYSVDKLLTILSDTI